MAKWLSKRHLCVIISINDRYASAIWEVRLCTISGIRGTAVKNAVRVVRIAICIFSMNSGEKTVPIYTKQKQGFDILCQRTGRDVIKSKAVNKSVCMTSDFFLEEADAWRDEAWSIIRMRPDVVFFLLTKRPQRVQKCLPYDWGDGWDNVFFNVSCANQQRADERIPILLRLPFKHKGVMCAPFIGAVSLKNYLKSGQIEQVLCDGENYAGARPCHYEWVKQLRDECEACGVTFVFCGTGRRFVKDGRLYRIESSELQSSQAYKSGLSYQGKPINFKLTYPLGMPVPQERRYTPYYGEKCQTCGMKPICNGCTRCGKCQPNIQA